THDRPTRGAGSGPRRASSRSGPRSRQYRTSPDSSCAIHVPHEGNRDSPRYRAKTASRAERRRVPFTTLDAPPEKTAHSANEDDAHIHDVGARQAGAKESARALEEWV